MAMIAFPISVGRRRHAISQGGIVGLISLVLSVSSLSTRAQSGEAGYVMVQTASVRPHLQAYGQVELGATLTVSFAEAGVVAGLDAAPGAQVRAGRELAHLEGTEIHTVLRQSLAEVQRAQSQLRRSRRLLVTQRQQLALHLITREAIQPAERTLAQARASLAYAQLRLQIVRETMVLRAPMDAKVIMANVTDGQPVAAGQPIFTLQTPYQLWLQAAYYGFDLSLIRAGMRGMFSPADGSESVPVRVFAVFGLQEAGGGASLTLVPSNRRSRWVDGEFGTVTLDLPPRLLVGVPTRSLILDQGKWWVMVHTLKGDQPQAVVPGPTRGWETFLEQGLVPGTQVLVDNAYLVFHRDISQRYQPPD